MRCLVLTGEGRGFCSGADLTARSQRDPNASVTDVVRKSYNVVVQRLRTIEKPVIAAVNGVAAGAGMSLALACDIPHGERGGVVHHRLRADRVDAG